MGSPPARISYYDNVKGILILLVVFGHVIQKYIHHSRSYLYIPFIIIYTFHMPLFVFLSGFFSKDARKTRERAFERFLLPYIVWAFVYFVVISLSGWRNDFNFAIPWFAYWYFPSLFTLCLFLPLLLRIRLILPILAVLMPALGLFPDYGWQFSLSRTICFAPFFLLGYYCKAGFLEKLRERRLLVSLAALVLLGALLALCLAGPVRDRLGGIERALWLAEPYRASRLSWAEGLLCRGIIMAAAPVFGAFVLALTPGGKSFLTRAGRNSLVIFVFHGYFVQLLNDFFTVDPASAPGVLLLILVSLGITAILSLDLWNRGYTRFMTILQRGILKEEP